VKVPALGESITEGTLAQWLKKPGEAVAQDEPIASLETDKVSVEVPSPVAGTLSETLFNEGDTVEVGAIIARIGEGHFRRILSDLNPPAPNETRRAVLCSGKVSYELMEARDAAGDTGTEIIRIEQLYPFPAEPLVKRLAAMPKLEELVWAQEEAKNNGAWFFVEDRLESCLAEAGHKGMRPRYAGRSAAASPATGLAKRHAAEQAALIADALGHSSRTAATAAKVL
jgi:pyruvate/2-oxoglutarate dehydrogenase complex dihydrolipoamide acyltransferase (E2) component